MTKPYNTSVPNKTDSFTYLENLLTVIFINYTESMHNKINNKKCWNQYFKSVQATSASSSLASNPYFCLIASVLIFRSALLSACRCFISSRLLCIFLSSLSWLFCLRFRQQRQYTPHPIITRTTKHTLGIT